MIRAGRNLPPTVEARVETRNEKAEGIISLPLLRLFLFGNLIPKALPVLDEVLPAGAKLC